MTFSFFELAQALTAAGRPFATATVVRAEKPTSGKPGDRAIVTVDGALHGWIGGSCAEPTVIRVGLEALADDRSRLIRLSPHPGADPVPEGVEEAPMTCFSGGTLDIFVEPHPPRPRLIVAGSSPVAEALVRLGREMDYQVIALDPDAERDVEAAQETLRDVSELASRVTPLTFVVVATHGNFDEAALAAALRTNAAYVGLVSSRKRGEAVREALRADGLTDEQIARVKLPAGLDIGARRGDEIALSILAELIGVRRGLDGIEWKEHGVPPSTARADAPSGMVQLGTILPRPGSPDLAVDPVCGMNVKIAGAQNTYEHEGTLFYFCCGGCRARFAREPGKYS